MSDLNLMIDWSLTPAECRMVLCLRNGSRCFATYRDLHKAISKGLFTEPDVVKTMMCRLRKKLAPFSVEILTVRGAGYQLGEGASAAIDRVVRPITEGAAA